MSSAAIPQADNSVICDLSDYIKQEYCSDCSTKAELEQIKKANRYFNFSEFIKCHPICFIRKENERLRAKVGECDYCRKDVEIEELTVQVMNLKAQVAMAKMGLL